MCLVQGVMQGEWLHTSKSHKHSMKFVHAVKLIFVQVYIFKFTSVYRNRKMQSMKYSLHLLDSICFDAELVRVELWNSGASVGLCVGEICAGVV